MSNNIISTELFTNDSTSDYFYLVSIESDQNNNFYLGEDHTESIGVASQVPLKNSAGEVLTYTKNEVEYVHYRDITTYFNTPFNPKITKLDSTGNTIWESFINDSNYLNNEKHDPKINNSNNEDYVDYSTRLTKIIIDKNQNIYVIGTTGDDIRNEKNAGMKDIFVTKLNNDGNHEWTELIGTSNYERSSDFVIDKDGSIYILGDTSTNDLGLQNPNYFDINTDILVTKLNQNGETQWTKIFEEEYKDRGGSIDIDNEGNIIFSKLGTSLYDGYDYSYAVYLTKLDQNGETLLQENVRMGFPLGLNDLKVDEKGSIFLTGTFSRQYNSQESNAYLMNFDSNFDLNWETNFESPEHDHPEKILLGDNNNSYVIGKTYGDLNGETKNNFQTINNRSDAFITKFDETGSNIWTKLYGSGESDDGFTARSNSDGSIDLIGTTEDELTFQTSFFILKSAEAKVTLGVVNENYIQNNNGFSSINGSKPVDISLDIGSLNSLYVKDYGGNVHGGDNLDLTPSSYKYQGMLDVNGDGVFEAIFTNKVSKRWVTAKVDSTTGQIDFDDYGAGGGTRVVGIYEDPLIAEGSNNGGFLSDGVTPAPANFGVSDAERYVEVNGETIDRLALNSQVRFQNDLDIDNLSAKHSGDYNSDGVSEVYWKTNDGTAYLRSLMHADGNIRYANYQSESQMSEYLTANGHESIIVEIT